MRTITKADLVSTLITIHSLSKRKSKKIVDHFFENIARGLEQLQTVKIAGLGRFIIHRKRKRIARNPKTGETAIVTPRTVSSFIPSITVKLKFRELAQVIYNQKNIAS